MSTAYRQFHVFGAGFTHRRSMASNGIATAFDDTYRTYASPTTLVEYYPWYIAPWDIARRIAQLNEDCLATYRERLKIQLVGYSFFGQTAANICRCLQEELPEYPAVTIDQLCLCDAVARRGRLGWVHALNPCSTIRIPRNVRLLNAFVQRHRRLRLSPPFFFPAGHRIVREVCTPAGYEWRDVDPWELDAEHTEIDNHPLFHNAVSIGAAAIHAGDDLPPASDNVQCDILPFPRPQLGRRAA